MAVEHRQVLLGRRELVDGDRHQVLLEILLDVLVQVVADAGPMGEQVLHRDVVADQGEVASQE